MAFGGKTAPYTTERLGEANLLTTGAQSEQQKGTELMGYETSGTLPAGAEAQVELGFGDAVKAIQARYGSLRETGSTMEADALARLNLEKTVQRFQIAQQFADQGLKLLQLGQQGFGAAGNIYAGLATQQMHEDEYLTDKIADFADAIGGAVARGGMPGAGAAPKATV